MRLAIDNFRGELPRSTPRGLPDSAAQAAVNARLLSGDLTAWRQFATEAGLSNTGPVRTIYRLAGTAWLSWDSDVDVARGTTGGDTTYRTYLTGPAEYAQPRMTTLALATSGAHPYPTQTRPLGVPPPDTTPAVTVTAAESAAGNVTATDACATLGGWTTSGYTNSGSTFSVVTIDAGSGNPAPSFRVESVRTNQAPAYFYRDFGIANATVLTMSADVAVTATIHGDYFLALRFANSSTGAGLGVILTNGTLHLGLAMSWDSSPASTASATAALATASHPSASTTWYTVRVSISTNADSTRTVTATVLVGGVTVATASSTMAVAIGGYCGGGVLTSVDDNMFTLYDNFTVNATGFPAADIITTATAYVFTFVNDLGQESAPSLPSATVTRPDGASVAVTTPTAAPSGVSDAYGITKKRIYRAVTGNSGTAYQFVAETPLAQAEYVDLLTDAELGAVLESDTWALPPDDLRGILALPNGVMAGFSKNQLCLSAQNYPHAWPVEYRLNTDTAIVAIGNVDNAVVIGTESHVYVAVGNDPAAYSMSKSEVPYACVSKRSLAYLTGVGVVFAGTDGLMAVAGVGQVRNLTENVFTLRQWQALAPSSITAVAHNDIYWMSYDTGTHKGCYAIDTRQNGFGVVEMAFHFTAAWVDPKTDRLFMVLDENAEPDDPSLPVHPVTPVYLSGTTIYEFDGDAAVPMTYRWRSKLWLAPPTAFSIAQVRAESYTNLLVRFYANGVQFYERAVTEETEFVLPLTDSRTQFEIELLGTDPVRVVQMAEDVLELG